MMKKNDLQLIEITDSGAVTAVSLTVNTLIHIMIVLKEKNPNSIESLVKEFKDLLQKYIGWLEKREPDGTAYSNRKKIKTLLQDAKDILSWDIIPTEEEMVKRAKLVEEYEGERESFLIEKKIKILFDSSFILSLVSQDSNSLKVESINGYLKPLEEYFEIYLPSFVILEVFSNLKNKYKYSYTNAKEKLLKVFEKIHSTNLLIGGSQLTMREILDRYKVFSRKSASSKLRGNDFMIATEGVLNEAMILTCDRAMFCNIKKFYNSTFFIGKDNDMSLEFIREFEHKRKSLDALFSNKTSS